MPLGPHVKAPGRLLSHVGEYEAGDVAAMLRGNPQSADYPRGKALTHGALTRHRAM